MATVEGEGHCLNNEILASQQTLTTGHKFHPIDSNSRCPIPEPVRSSLMPPRTRRQWFDFVLLRLPILSWLWTYQPRYMIGDVIAGITVSVMHIPQGLAYALLANLPPVYGLYTSFTAPIAYAVFGTSRHIAIGTFAVVSLMVGNAVQRLVTSNNIPCFEDSTYLMSGNMSNSTDLAVCENFKRDVVVTLAFLSGSTLILMSVLQLGFVSLFLSSALISGYTTGAAVHVATSQVPHLLDISAANSTVPPGALNVPKSWISIATNVVEGNVNVATIIISIISIFFLVVVRNINLCWARTKLHKKAPIPIPAQLILIIFATVISYFVGLNTRWGVSIVNKIAGGAPPLSVPVVQHIPSLIQDAVTIAVVTFAVSVSLARVFAKKNNYQISANQELLAYGISSICNSFLSGYSPSGSLSRSAVQETTGGKTQLVGIISSLILLAVIILIAPLFEPLPKAILSSIVIVALYGMFKQFAHLVRYWKQSRADLLVWMVVFLSTILLGVDLGLLVGVGFSLGVVVVRILLPMALAVGIEAESCGGTEDNHAKVCGIPGILIFRFYGPICYLNAGVFQAKVANLAGVKTSPSAEQAVGCWQAAYFKIKNVKRRKATRRAGRQQGDGLDGVEDGPKFSKSSELGSEPETPTSITSSSPPLLSNPTQSLQLIERQLNSQTGLRERRGPTVSKHGSPTALPDEPEVTTSVGTHSIILDCSAISFLDSVGADSLEQMIGEYEGSALQVLLAECPAHIVDVLERSGFLKSFGQEWFFPSVSSAVSFVQKGSRLKRVKSNSSVASASSSAEQSIGEDQLNQNTSKDDVDSPIKAESYAHIDTGSRDATGSGSESSDVTKNGTGSRDVTGSGADSSDAVGSKTGREQEVVMLQKVKQEVAV